ncbi:MAG: 23S rRNA (adenine(2030)-N(6))-methyltransferase RlmJ [Pseudomonadota bacterium]
MLSYQHAYHAGGPADLHKHAVLAELLALLTRKPRPITVIESHAGRGLYDLSAPEAAKTGEAAAGVLRHPPRPSPFAEALAATRVRHGESAYPGSPLVARHLLRAQDRLILCEAHPAEHAALKRALRGRAEIHRRDGHEGLRALTPPKPRRGLVLIDPSYERKDEYAATAETALATLARWPEAVVAVWYPVLAALRHEGLIACLARARLPGFHDARVHFPTAAPGHGMTGSGMACLNLPHGGEAALTRALAAVGAAVCPVSGPVSGPPARKPL